MGGGGGGVGRYHQSAVFYLVGSWQGQGTRPFHSVVMYLLGNLHFGNDVTLFKMTRRCRPCSSQIF